MPPTSSTAFVSARPRFRIDGLDKPNLGEAVLSLKVRLPQTGMANAELLALNWGETGSSGPDFLFQDLRLGSRLEILLGESASQPSFKGEITAIEERYGNGAPQIAILAEDALHRLARTRASHAFEDMSLDDVIQQVASNAGLSADVQVSSATGTWLQVNESHLAFLLRLLAPYDVSLRVQDGTLRAKDEEPDASPLTITPERARLIADLNHQPTELSVKGYSLKDDSAADSTQQNLSPAPRGQTATQVLGNLGWTSPSIPPHPFARSQSEAEALATKQFRQKASRFIHGEVTCRDATSLSSGREIELAGLSPRFNGKYRVIECQHTFDSTQGLSTHLQVQRPDLERIAMSGHSLGSLHELHLGQVLDNSDPESRGRIQVRLHATGLEVWASVMVPSAGNGYGISWLPRQAEQVVVAFISPDLPMVIGSVWSGSSSAPSDSSPVEERYFVQSPAGIKFLMDDNAPKVRIETPTGYHITLDDQSQTVVVMKGSEKIEMSSSGITITTPGKLKVEASQVEVTAAMVKVNAAMSQFSGVVQCDTLITNAVVSSTYTPGAGNVW